MSVTRREQHERLHAVVGDASGAVLGYLTRRVDSPEDAADLLGETLLVAWRRKNDLPADDERARMWLFGVAKGLLANYHRGVFRRNALAARLRGELDAVAAQHPDPADAAEIRAAVNDLPDDQRELVMLVHWDGFSIAEAAALLEVNPSTARTRYARARTELARALATAETPTT